MFLQVYPRFKALFIAIIFLMLVVIFILVIINIFGMIFKKLGFPPEYSVYFLFLSLLCSYVNLPVRKITSDIMPGTSIEVNLGGAVIPVVLSIFLSTMVSLIDVLIGILVMTTILYKMAKPVKGSGMAIHLALPPILAAAVAFTISSPEAPVIAYIIGTLGCLIGVDILNLKKLPELEAPVVSIGGGGTFDAIFLTGIISVLLA